MLNFENVRRAMVAQNYSPEKIAEIMAICEGYTRSRSPYVKDLSGPTWVYVIVDPRNRKPFYVGITKYLWYRFDQHRTDSGSAAWPRVNELLAAGYSPVRIHKPYRLCADRNEALRLEHRLINSIPGLLNRERRLSQMFDYGASA
jgi:predicted GIY-YIG superfamily endonuclease